MLTVPELTERCILCNQGHLGVLSRMLTSTELTSKMYILAFIEVLGKMVTATGLTKKCILGNQGLFKGTGLNAISNRAH